MSHSLCPHESQHSRRPCPSPTPGVYSNSCPSSWWCHPAISSSVVPFSSCPQSLPVTSHQGLFQWVKSSHKVAKVLEFQLQHQSFQWTPRTDLNLGIEPRSPALQVDFLPSEPLGKPENTGVVSLSLLQGIFPTQESRWCLLHCRRILYQLSYQGNSI